MTKHTPQDQKPDKHQKTGLTLITKVFTVLDVPINLASWLGGFFIVILTLLITVSTSSRYFLDRPFSFTEDISGWLMLSFVFLGLSYAMRNEAHLRIRIVLDRTHQKVRVCIEIMALVVALLYSFVLMLGTIYLVADYYERSTVSLTLHFPLFIPGMVMPIGLMLLIIIILRQLWQRIAGQEENK